MVVMPPNGLVYKVGVVSFCYVFCLCYSFCLPILACRLLGESLPSSGNRGAPIGAWVPPWSKLHVRTNINQKQSVQQRSRISVPLIACTCLGLDGTDPSGTGVPYWGGGVRC